MPRRASGDASVTAGGPVRVFLVDDHELMRRVLRQMLSEAGGLQVIGDCGSALEALRLIPSLRPHVAVLDVRLPDGSGIDLCRSLRATHPEIRSLMNTSVGDPQIRQAAADAGAWGYVTKQIHGNDLVEEIRRVAAGSVPMTTRSQPPASPAGRAQPDDRAILPPADRPPEGGPTTGGW